MGAPWQPGTSKNRGTRMSSGGCMTPARRAVAGSLVLAGVGVAWVAGAAGPYLHAERMLDAAVVPPGSVQVIFLPGAVFAQPSQEPACTPLIDQTRYWMVPGDPQDIAAFLRAHAPPGIPNNGTGQLSTTGGQPISYDVLDAERGKSGGFPAELDLTVAALGAGVAGIRADAEVVPPTPRAPIPEDPHPYLRRRPPRGNVTCYGTSARGGAAAAVVALARRAHRRALAQLPFRLALTRRAQALPH